jgi:hypothetical protein
MLNDLMREVIVRFVDIGVIFYYRCFNIPFINIISFKIQGISAVSQPFFNFQLEFNEITQQMEGQTVYLCLLLFLRNVRCDKEHVISQSESVALNEDNFTRSPPSGIGDDFGYPVLSALVFLNFLVFEITQQMEGQTVYLCLLLFSSSLFFQIISTLPEQLCSFKVA